MQKIWNDEHEKNLNSIVFYGDTTASKLYYDKEKKRQVIKADSVNAFNRARVIIKVGEVSHTPIECTADGSLVILDTASAVTAKT